MLISTVDAFSAKIVLISGSEPSLRRKAYEELVRDATRDGDFDLQIFASNESTAAEWLGSASTSPFLSEKRTVVVRNVLRAGPPEETFEGLDSALSTLPDSALLILVADDEAGDDNKQRTFDSLRKKWETFFTKRKAYVASFSPEPKQLKSFVKAELENLGKSMSERAIDTLTEMCGMSLSRCLDELEKLSLYVGDATTISDDDVRRVVIPSREWNVYKLVDAMIEGSLPEALKHLSALTAGAPKPEDAAFSRIFPTVIRQLRLIYQARLFVDAKAEPTRIPEALKPYLPETGLISKEQDWKIPNYMRAARRVSLDQIGHLIEAVARADSRLKGIEDGVNGYDTLERMVGEMAIAVRRSS